MTFSLPALNDNGDVFINFYIKQLPGRFNIEAFKMSAMNLVPLNLQQLGLKCADGLIQQDQKIYATDKNGFNLFGEIECRSTVEGDEPISTIFYANPHQVKIFSEEEISFFIELSQNGMIAGVNDESFYQVDQQRFIPLYNQDGSKFIRGGTSNQIIKVTDNYILATDMRKDLDLRPNNAILLCELTGKCHNIFKTRIPIKDGTIMMSDNEEYIYLVSDQGQGKVLMLLDKYGNIILGNIKIDGLDLNKVNINRMEVTETGVLLLQVRDQNRQRPIYILINIINL